MAKKLFLLLSAMVLIAPPAHARDMILNVTLKDDTVMVYQPVTIQAKVAAQFADPYDPREVELNARIKDPDGKEVVMPGFFAGEDKIWQVRYTPVKAGSYSFSVALESTKGFDNSKTYYFDVMPSRKDGFLRRSAKNHRYLVFDSGKPFFGIGYNVCWTSTNTAATFAGYFKKLSENGCNMTRIWLNNKWSLKVESEALGKYSAEGSAELDGILQAARDAGVYIILTMDSYSSLMEGEGEWKEESWATNVYNRKNGGPCESPWDFFTDRQAKRLYKKRLRYILARWSHSPNILAFEFWNELDAPKEWVAEMTGYIRAINPHGQLLTTSLGYPWANNFDETAIWSMKEIDIVSRHIYGNMASDITDYMISTNRALSDKTAKPILVEEFGMNIGKNDMEYDPDGEGVALHNSLWSSLVSGSCGSAMNWWWDSYMKRHDFYPHYRALRAFLKGVNWDSGNVGFAKTSDIVMNDRRNKPVYTDVAISGKDIWGDTSYGEFTVARNGDISGGTLNHYLHGISRTDIRIEPVFNVDYPADGEFIINVSSVSQGATLVVKLDGKVVLNKEFVTGPGEGPWKNSCFLKGANAYQCYYGTSEKIKIPKGKHVVKISNVGKDWMGIKRIVLTNYKDADLGAARVAGIIVGDDTIFWIHNKAYNWRNVTVSREKLSPVGKSFFYMYGAEDGVYEIRWYDTLTGEIVSSDASEAANGQVKVDVPGFSRDIACRIKKARSKVKE